MMKKMILTILGALGISLVLGVVVFCVMAYLGPETYVVSGRQLPIRYVDQLRSLGLVDEGETIVFFYSDALMNIEDGLYFVSDTKLVAYCKDWESPTIRIPLDSVVAVSLERDESFLIDSGLWIKSKGEEEFSIPISSEQGGDKKFFEYLQRMCKNLEAIEDPSGTDALEGEPDV